MGSQYDFTVNRLLSEVIQSVSKHPSGMLMVITEPISWSQSLSEPLFLNTVIFSNTIILQYLIIVDSSIFHCRQTPNMCLCVLIFNFRRTLNQQLAPKRLQDLFGLVWGTRNYVAAFTEKYNCIHASYF